MKPICITFAGAVGSSKTPTAHALSLHLGLPILSNDAIRTEVVEDLGAFDEYEYIVRRDQRLSAAMERHSSFIYDVSIDRVFPEIHDQLRSHGFDILIISMDLSEAKLKSLYRVKKYTESLERLTTLLDDHDKFLVLADKDITLHIGDAEFPRRLELALETVTPIVAKRQKLP